jgi:hypothetical protein
VNGIIGLNLGSRADMSDAHLKKELALRTAAWSDIAILDHEREDEVQEITALYVPFFVLEK